MVASLGGYSLVYLHICLLYHPGYIHRPPYYALPVPPWVYTILPLYMVLYDHATLAVTMPGDEALGSRGKKPPGERPLRVLKS